MLCSAAIAQATFCVPQPLLNSQWQFQVEQALVRAALLFPRAAAPMVPARTERHVLKEKNLWDSLVESQDDIDGR